MSPQPDAAGPPELVVRTQAVQDLRTALVEAAGHVEDLVLRCQRQLHVKPAMGDPASVDFANYLNDFHTGPVGSVLAALTDYLHQLRRVAATLDAVDLSYPRTEDDIVQVLTRATSA